MPTAPETSVIVAACVGLASAVTYLFRLVMSQSRDQSDLRERVGRVEGRHQGIEDLSAKTLETVRQAITGPRD